MDNHFVPHMDNCFNDNINIINNINNIILEINEETNEKLILTIKNIDLSIINALRRIIIAEIPCYCIDTVEIIKNTSVLEDYNIEQRLMLIPLQIPSLNLEDHNINCDCNYCSTILSVNVKNDTLDIIDVTTNNFTSSSDIFFSNSNPITITKLRPGDSFILDAHIKLGIAKLHTKWSTISNCYHWPLNLSQDDNSFLFCIESNGSYTASKIMSLALNILTKQLSFLRLHLDNYKSLCNQ